MTPPREKASVRMQEARERLDAFEAQEAPAEPPAASQNPRAALIFWMVVAIVGLAIYIFAAWMQRH
jgi:CHASE3 domain sensor protein